MPRSTVKFRFEWRVREWAMGLLERLGHRDGRLLVVLAGDAIASMHVWPRGGHERDREDPLAERDRWQPPDGSWLYYDPFDAPDYMWLAWNRIERRIMERLIGVAFADEDFAKWGDATERMEYPESWGVMF